VRCLVPLARCILCGSRRQGDVRNHEGSASLPLRHLPAPSSTASVEELSNKRDLVVAALHDLQRPDDPSRAQHLFDHAHFSRATCSDQWTPNSATRKSAATPTHVVAISTINSAYSTDLFIRWSDMLRAISVRRDMTAKSVIDLSPDTCRASWRSASRLAKVVAYAALARPSGHAARQLPAHACLPLRPQNASQAMAANAVGRLS
jgi:hypothetical protein